MAIRESHARSVSAVAELSGPRTTAMTTSSPSRLMVTADPDCRSRARAARGASAEAPTRRRRPPCRCPARSTRAPRARPPRAATPGRCARGVRARSPAASAGSRASSSRRRAPTAMASTPLPASDGAPSVGRRRHVGVSAVHALAQTLGGALRFLRQQPAELLPGELSLRHAREDRGIAQNPKPQRMERRPGGRHDAATPRKNW